MQGQVRLCREKTTRTVYAMKKLKKSEMLRRGQVILFNLQSSFQHGYSPLIKPLSVADCNGLAMLSF